MVYHWGGCIVSLTNFASVKVLLWLAFIRSGWNSSPSTKSQLLKMALVANRPPSFHNSSALSKYLTSEPQHSPLWSRYNITSQGCGEDSTRCCASRTQGSPWHAEGAVQEYNQHESGPTLWPHIQKQGEDTARLCHSVGAPPVLTELNLHGGWERGRLSLTAPESFLHPLQL